MKKIIVGLLTTLAISCPAVLADNVVDFKAQIKESMVVVQAEISKIAKSGDKLTDEEFEAFEEKYVDFDGVKVSQEDLLFTGMYEFMESHSYLKAFGESK